LWWCIEIHRGEWPAHAFMHRNLLIPLIDVGALWLVDVRQLHEDLRRATAEGSAVESSRSLGTP
jgi:hypothetical protein